MQCLVSSPAALSGPVPGRVRRDSTGQPVEFVEPPPDVLRIAALELRLEKPLEPLLASTHT